jgi:hypothetical protein
MWLTSISVVVSIAVAAPPSPARPAPKPIATLDGFTVEKLPAGFTLESEPEVYGTPTHKERSGTIFDYIDGGGQVYLQHGMRKALHLRLIDQRQRVLTADVFDMASPANAAAALADEGICAPGADSVDVGAPAKVHHFAPEYLLYLVKGRYLIYLSATDELAAVVRGLARQLADAIH